MYGYGVRSTGSEISCIWFCRWPGAKFRAPFRCAVAKEHNEVSRSPLKAAHPEYVTTYEVGPAHTRFLGNEVVPVCD